MGFPGHTRGFRVPRETNWTRSNIDRGGASEEALHPVTLLLHQCGIQRPPRSRSAQTGPSLARRELTNPVHVKMKQHPCLVLSVEGLLMGSVNIQKELLTSSMQWNWVCSSRCLSTCLLKNSTMPLGRTPARIVEYAGYAVESWQHWPCTVGDSAMELQ